MLENEPVILILTQFSNAVSMLDIQCWHDHLLLSSFATGPQSIRDGAMGGLGGYSPLRKVKNYFSVILAFIVP